MIYYARTCLIRLPTRPGANEIYCARRRLVKMQTAFAKDVFDSVALCNLRVLLRLEECVILRYALRGQVAAAFAPTNRNERQRLVQVQFLFAMHRAC